MKTKFKEIKNLKTKFNPERKNAGVKNIIFSSLDWGSNIKSVDLLVQKNVK